VTLLRLRLVIIQLATTILNCLVTYFAQTEALMNGKTEEEVTAELQKTGKSKEESKKLMKFKVFKGNKPTNSFLLKELTPKVSAV
jgi:glucose-6-phosphate isomerase